jgi:hypothetical protein
MKKLFFALLVALVALPALAQMIDRDYDFSLVTTNAGSRAYTIRGELEGVWVEIPTGKTATVAVATAEMTVFSKADITSATDGFFPVRIPLYSTAGVALTEVDAGANTNAIVGKAPLAGAVTVTVTPKAATTGTNAYAVKLIYNP